MEISTTDHISKSHLVVEGTVLLTLSDWTYHGAAITLL